MDDGTASWFRTIRIAMTTVLSAIKCDAHQLMLTSIPQAQIGLFVRPALVLNFMDEAAQNSQNNGRSMNAYNKTIADTEQKTERTSELPNERRN